MRTIAAFTGSEEPGFVDLPEPNAPGEREVLCRTLELGVCGTDREILLSRRPWVPPQHSFLALGHECLARVEAVGSSVSSLRPGQLVVPLVRRPRGIPRYRPDMLAFGEFTERGIVEEHGFSQPMWLDRPEYLVPVPDDLRKTAVFTEPLAVAEKGINEATIVQQARLHDAVWREHSPRVLVTGLGPIAFASIIACHCRNWPVTVYGRDEADTDRARLAAEFGASYRTAKAFRPPGNIEQDGFDLILECTGSDEVAMSTAESLASRGVMVWLGSTRIPETRPHAVELLMRNAILRNHLFLATVNAAIRDFDAALADLTMAQTRFPGSMAKVFTARVDPGESLWHYRYRQPQGIKTVLDFGSVAHG